MEEKILFIINPNASKGKARTKAEEIKDFFKSNNKDIHTIFTEHAGHAETLAYEGSLSGYDTIIAAGGDGCINEVANGIMKAGGKAKMGIIPIGRGNDYAFALNIPSDVKKACSLIAERRGKRVDVGLVKGGMFDEGRYFLNGTGFGFEPLVNFKAMEYRHINGMPSYVLAFIRILLKCPCPYDIELETDREKIRLNTQQVSVCIGRRMGSSFMLAPSALVDDGYFDILYTKHPFRSFGLIKAALAFITGKHVNMKRDFEVYRAKEVKIRSERSDIACHADGEIVAKGNGKDFDVSLLANALFVYC